MRMGLPFVRLAHPDVLRTRLALLGTVPLVLREHTNQTKDKPSACHVPDQPVQARQPVHPQHASPGTTLTLRGRAPRQLRGLGLVGHMNSWKRMNHWTGNYSLLMRWCQVIMNAIWILQGELQICLSLSAGRVKVLFHFSQTQLKRLRGLCKTTCNALWLSQQSCVASQAPLRDTLCLARRVALADMAQMASLANLVEMALFRSLKAPRSARLGELVGLDSAWIPA